MRDVKKSYYRYAILLGSALIFLSLLAWVGKDLFNSLEFSSLTVRQRLASLPPQNRFKKTPLVLINYDVTTQASVEFQHLFGEPMSRSAPAYLARFLQRAHAKSILFDLSFNGGIHENDPKGDNALVESVSNSKTPISSALIFNQAQTTALLAEHQNKNLLKNKIQIAGLDSSASMQVYRYTGLVPPYPALLNSPMHFYAANAVITNSGNDSNNSHDLLNESRRWSPFLYYGNQFYPTLALGVALNGVDGLSLNPNSGLVSWIEDKGRRQIHLGPDLKPLLNWHGHGVDPSQPVYPEYSFSDAVFTQMAFECDNKAASFHPTANDCALVKKTHYTPLPLKNIQNRYALIGLALTTVGDVHPSIYGPRYPGVYILANTLDNLLHDDFILPAPYWLNSLLILCFAFLPLLLNRFFRIGFISLIWIAGLSIAYFFVTLYAYEYCHTWILLISPLLAFAASYTYLFITLYLKERQQRQQLRSAFGKYVSPTVMEMVEKNPDSVRLGGERRTMIFLFSDIRDFTAFAEKHPPEIVQGYLSDYFSLMNRIILHDFNGSINKLMGDAIMAYWGFPFNDADQAFFAVSAALKMKEAIQTWHTDPNKPKMRIGIGLHSGEAMIGNVGSADFMDFTVIGDAVNVASRLEHLTKELGVDIIISDSIYEQVKDRIEVRSLGPVTLRGKELAIEIYEPLNLKPS
jgi:adenylate cyclase